MMDSIPWDHWDFPVRTPPQPYRHNLFRNIASPVDELAHAATAARNEPRQWELSPVKPHPRVSALPSTVPTFRYDLR